MKRPFHVLSVILLFYPLLLLAQPHYLVTIHPLAEILKQVCGERATVQTLMPPGASPHTYEFKPTQLKAADSANALFYGASNLDGWSARFDNIEKISLFELLPDSLHLPVVAQFGQRKGVRLGSDPHFWMDPLATAALLPNLLETLHRLDPEGSPVYQRNARLFLLNLVQLNSQMKEMLAPLEGEKFLLSHPFLQYFLKRYRMKSIGIIEPAPGAEPTAKELAEIIRRSQGEKIVAVLVNRNHSERPPFLVSEATGSKLIALDPLGVAGETYPELLLKAARGVLEILP